MARKKPSQSQSAPQNQGSKDAPAAGGNPLVFADDDWRMWTALAGLLLGYWVLFARVPLGPVSRGMLYLLLPFDPGSLLQQWTGGDASRIGVFSRVLVFFTAAAWIAAAYVCGALLLSWIRHRPRGRVEWLALATALGLHLLSIWVLCFGLLCSTTSFEFQSRWPFLTTIGIALGLACWRRDWLWPKLPSAKLPSANLSSANLPSGNLKAAGLRESQANVEQNDRPEPSAAAAWNRSATRSQLGFWFLLVPFSAILLGAAALPPWEFDVKEYHLQAPKEWYHQGEITFLPHNVYANMPLGAEMHALGGMILYGGKDAAWRGALVGKVAIASMNLIAAMALYAFAARLASPRAGMIAAVLYISWPWAFHVAAAGLIDGALALYVTLTFLAMYSFLQSQSAVNSAHDASDDPSADSSWLLISAIAAGAAASTKYTGLIFALAPAAAWCGLALCRHCGFAKAIKSVGLFVLVAALTASPWYLKNALQTGNPTYPLLASALGGKTRNEAKTEQWNKAHQTPRDEQGRRFTLQQAAAATSVVFWKSPWHHPLVVPLAALCLVGPYYRRLSLPAWLAVLCLLAVWFFFTHRIDRFWIPCGPLMCLLAGLGAAQGSSRLWRRCLNTLLAVTSLAVFCVLASRYATPDNRILVDYSELRHDSPHPADPNTWTLTPAHRFLNENTPPGSAVLLVGDAQPFDIAPKVFYNTCFDDNLLELWIQDASPEQQHQALRSREVAFVLVDWGEIQRYRASYGFTDFVQPELFLKMQAKGVLERVPYPDATPSVQIYAVRSDLAPISSIP